MVSFHLPGGTWSPPQTQLCACSQTEPLTVTRLRATFRTVLWFYKVFVAVGKAGLEKGLACSAVAMGEQRCFPYRHFVG